MTAGKFPRKTAVLFFVAFSTVGTSLRAGNLVTNGGFETPVAPVNGLTTLTGNQLPGWTILFGSVDVVNKGFWPANEDSQSLDLDGTGNAGQVAGAIQQSITTVVGQIYQLQFVYANDPNAPANEPTRFAQFILIGSKPFDPINLEHKGSTKVNMMYTPVDLSFRATATTMTLRFESLDPPSSQFGIVLDSVSVTAVPEPTSILSLGLGIAGMLTFLRLRNKSRQGSGAHLAAERDRGQHDRASVTTPFELEPS
jgi:choice-of-anchor C domain-containing protein